MALTWIAEIAGLDLTSTMTFAPRIAAVVLPALSASEDASRETSISINQVSSGLACSSLCRDVLMPAVVVSPGDEKVPL